MPTRTNAALFLGFVALVFFGKYLLGVPVSTDLIYLLAPLYSLRWDGGPPLWNPYLGCGMPMDGNLHFAPAYPLRWLFFFVSDWRGFFGPYFFAHFVIGLIGANRLMRALAVDRLSAVTGALVFMAGGQMMGRFVNPTIFLGCCWLPWLLSCAISRRRSAGPLITLFVAAILWVGAPHVIIYGAVGFLFAWFLFRPRGSGLSAKARRRRWTFKLLYAAAGVVAGLDALLPGLLQVAGSVRNATNVELNLKDSLQWREVPFSLLGGSGGGIYAEVNDKTLYVGVAALMLAVLSLLRRRAIFDRRRQFGIGLVVLGLVFALGNSIGWQHVMAYLPGFRLLIGPARALMLSALGLAILAAIGMQDLRARIRFTLPSGLVGLAIFIGAVVSSILGISRLSSIGFVDSFIGRVSSAESFQGLGFISLDLILAFLVIAAIYVLLHRRRIFLRRVLLLVIVIQLSHFSRRVEAPVVDRSYFDPPPSAQLLMDRAAKESFRIFGFDALQTHSREWENVHKVDYLAPNLATIYRLEDVRVADPQLNLDYATAMRQAAGVAPFSDQMRQVEPELVTDALAERFDVRFVIGNPWDRRLAGDPIILHPDHVQESFSLPEAESAITAWRFVSLLNSPIRAKLGQEVARLEITAVEGTFSFPIRYGIETAFIDEPDEWRLRLPAQTNAIWRTATIQREEGFSRAQANFRATINFERPLLVREIRWKLGTDRVAFYILNQACRIEAAQPDPWRLISTPSEAPVYEWTGQRDGLNARQFVIAGDLPATEYKVRPAVVTDARIQVLNRSSSSITYRVTTPQPGWLYMRESYAPGWTAHVNGNPAEVVQADGIFRAVRLPAGTHVAELKYVPRLFLGLLCLSVFTLAGVFGLHFYRRRNVTILEPSP